MIVRLGAMGDVIHALPAVAALRTALPNSTVGWVIEERWVELLAGPEDATGLRSSSKPLVDVIHAVNTRSWRSSLLSGETWKESIAAIDAIRDRKYDVAIDFQGAWKSALIAQLSGAPTRLGFSHPREYGASVFYTHQVEPEMRHVIDQNLELVSTTVGAAPFPKGGGAQQSNLLPADPAAELWADNTLRQNNLQPGQFTIINPGAGWGAKCWPTTNYATVARGLAELGLRSLINFGPAEEQLAEEVLSKSNGTAVAIPCSIAELIAITRRAALFIGGDTGPMHLAAALRVPVVGIFGPTDPARNGPYGTDSIVLRREESVTNHSRRAAPDESMLTITSQEVLDAACLLLHESPATKDAPNA